MLPPSVPMAGAGAGAGVGAVVMKIITTLRAGGPIINDYEEL